MSNNRPRGVNLKPSDFKIRNGQVFINTDITKRNTGMLLIWADWCGHCHRFIPTFNEIFNKLGKDFCCVSIESADLNGQNKLMSQLDFNGYPTICFFDQHGMIINKYNGGRDMKTMLNEICKVYHHCTNIH